VTGLSLRFAGNKAAKHKSQNSKQIKTNHKNFDLYLRKVITFFDILFVKQK